MLHLYWGDGKGKTTAAMGLALRALGHGRRVVILQFLKDGSSGEIEMLRRCGAVVYACPNAKFTWLMTDAERAEARRTNTRTLQTILQGSFDLLVLDDLGSTALNDFTTDKLFEIVDERYRSGKPLIVTTNLNPDEAWKSSIGMRRIFDRLRERCRLVVVDGESRRRAC